LSTRFVNKTENKKKSRLHKSKEVIDQAEDLFRYHLRALHRETSSTAALAEDDSGVAAAVACAASPGPVIAHVLPVGLDDALGPFLLELHATVAHLLVLQEGRWGWAANNGDITPDPETISFEAATYLQHLPLDECTALSLAGEFHRRPPATDAAPVHWVPVKVEQTDLVARLNGGFVVAVVTKH
jgi:hypothetical protein